MSAKRAKAKAGAKKKAAKKAPAKKAGTRPAKKGTKKAAKKPSPRKDAAPGPAPASAGAAAPASAVSRDPARKARAPFATGRKAKKAPKPMRMGAAPRPRERAETLPPFMPPVAPDEALAKLVGPEPRPRTLFLRLVWIWLKSRNLLGGDEKDTIFPNQALKKVLGGRDEVPKSELREYVNAHLRSGG